MPLIGTLNDISLPNLIQLQSTEQNRTQVILSRNGHQGKLLFDDGELVFAKAGDKLGDDAVFELLKWDDGTFRVDTEDGSIERNVHMPTNALLLEGLRRLDESRAPRFSPDNNWSQIFSSTINPPKAQSTTEAPTPNRPKSKILVGMIGLAVIVIVLVVLATLSALALGITYTNRQLENQVDGLATQIALLQMVSQTPKMVSQTPNLPIATTVPPTLTPTPAIIASTEAIPPTLTPTPAITASTERTPPTLTPTPAITASTERTPSPVPKENSQPIATTQVDPWIFQGYVFQWNGSRQNSTVGIKDVPVVLLDDCKSAILLAQAKTEEDGHFTIEYDASNRLTAPTKFCIATQNSLPWNSPKSPQPAINWKEAFPGAIESIVPFSSPAKVTGQNVFYFSIKRTITGKVLDENYVPVPGTQVALRLQQGNFWIDLATTSVKNDGDFVLTHESSSPDGGYYQLLVTSLANYEGSDRSPSLVGDEWKSMQTLDRTNQMVESTKPLNGTDFPQVITFYQRLRIFEHRPSQPTNLYTDSKGNTVKAVLVPNSSFHYKILNRGEKRTQILILVSTDQTIPPKTGLINPEKPVEIKNATFGEAKIPIYIVATDPDRPGWGWIEGYLDNQ
jgi:hypothetical protein